MKKTLTIILLCIATIHLKAQTNYDQGMEKAFQLWGADKTQEASQLFERITKIEKDKWLPPYYVATIEIISSFSIKDEVTLNNKLKKAQTYLDIAKSIAPNTPEIIINQALLNIVYINFDGQKYGMTLSGENIALYEKALKIAPNNPRVLLGKAEWDMGSAKYFGNSIAPYCKDVEKAIELFKQETLPKFFPSKGLERAIKVLENCKKS